MPNPIFDAPLTSTLVPTTAGNPTFTFTRATTAYVADNEGILRNAIANEARFQGARRVRNLLNGSKSQAFTVADVWANAGSGVNTIAVTNNVGVAPDGTTTAARMLATAGPTASDFAYIAANPGLTYTTHSIWVKSNTGSPQVFCLTTAANVIQTMTATTAWQRFTATFAQGTQQLTLMCYPFNGSAAALDILVWGAQSEYLGGASNQAPGEYVSSGVLSSPWHGNAIDGVKYFPTLNGNSVTGNIVTEAQGTLIPTATLLGYVAENAATNLCLQSQTFDNATYWTAENGAIAANDAAVVAPDGTITADRFTDNATGATHRMYQPLSGMTNAVPYTFSVYVKQGTLPWVQILFQISAVTWVNFNLATGAVGNKSAGAVASVQALPNGWFRVTVTGTTTATVGCYAQMYALNADTNAPAPGYVGTGQTMYLWGAQVEQSSDPTSYIPTVAVSVTRNGDSLQYANASNFPAAVGSSYTEHYLPVAAAGAYQMNVRVLGNGTMPQYYEPSKAFSFYAGTIFSVANARVVGAVNRGASAWTAGGTASLCLNGGVVATGAAVAFSAVGNITIGGDATNTIQGSIRNVKFYAERLTDAQLIDLTEDGVLTPDVVPVTTQPGGIGRYRRRRIEVEIDGEIFPVASEEEGRELLLKAREAAKQAAQAAAVRAAAKAEKKTSPAAVERALALSTPRISLRADDRSEALAQAIQAQVDAAQAAIDEDYATARRMAYAYVRQRLQDEQRQRELAADEEEVIAMILRLP